MYHRSQAQTQISPFRRSAERIAAERRESVTTTHLLCAIAEAGGPAWELLRDRKLTAGGLLKAARTSSDDTADPLGQALKRAIEVAQSMRAPEPTAVHLLVALMSQRQCAAFRSLEQFGVDVGRLRVAAMNTGLGQVGRQHIQTRRSGSLTRTSSAVTVPLTPKPRPIKGRTQPEKTVNPAESVPLSLNAIAPAASKTGRRTPRRTGVRATKLSAKSRFNLDKRRFKLLTTLGRNLTQLCQKGELPVVVGRASEVDQVLDVLAKCEGNSPCLVGAAGVGKTSVAYGVAQRIVQAAEAGGLDDRIIVELSVGDLLAGTGVRGALAQKFVELKQEVAASDGRVVLFIDDIHQLFTSGGADEVVSELKRNLGVSSLPCIGATSASAFEQLVEGDAALSRLFTPVEVNEPELAAASEMVESLSERFEAHHHAVFTQEACGVAVAWSARYMSGRALPDKAISVLDFAGARCHRRGIKQVEPTHVAEVVSEMADVPIERLLETDGQRLLRLEATVQDSVVGHDEAVQRMARIIRRNAAGLGGGKPIGTFLLLGPTGVGKTETAKALASALFGSKQSMTRLDLSEFSEAHAVARLIGAPPGYIGHENGGQLTEAVRKRPYQVLLLDEIEKAHPEVLETFLPLFDEGRLTDGRGRTVDFTNTVIILTSNIGGREATATPARSLGFGVSKGQDDTPDITARVEQAAKQSLSPEFYNRLDEVIVFAPLTEAEVEEIARRLLQKLADTMLMQRKIDLSIEPSVVELLLRKGGFDASLGARPMRRAIARWVEAPLAEALLAGELRDGHAATLSAHEGELSISSLRPAEPVAAE